MFFVRDVPSPRLVTGKDRSRYISNEHQKGTISSTSLKLVGESFVTQTYFPDALHGMALLAAQKDTQWSRPLQKIVDLGFQAISKFGVVATCFFSNNRFQWTVSDLWFGQRQCKGPVLCWTETAAKIEASRNSKVQLDCRRFSQRNEALTAENHV